MPRTIEYDGRRIEVPDDATDDEVVAVLEASDRDLAQSEFERRSGGPLQPGEDPTYLDMGKQAVAEKAPAYLARTRKEDAGRARDLAPKPVPEASFGEQVAGVLREVPAAASDLVNQGIAEARALPALVVGGDYQGERARLKAEAAGGGNVVDLADRLAAEGSARLTGRDPEAVAAMLRDEVERIRGATASTLPGRLAQGAARATGELAVLGAPIKAIGLIPTMAATGAVHAEPGQEAAGAFRGAATAFLGPLLGRWMAPGAQGFRRALAEGLGWTGATAATGPQSAEEAVQSFVIGVGQTYLAGHPRATQPEVERAVQQQVRLALPEGAYEGVPIDLATGEVQRPRQAPREPQTPRGLPEGDPMVSVKETIREAEEGHRVEREGFREEAARTRREVGEPTEMQRKAAQGVVDLTPEQAGEVKARALAQGVASEAELFSPERLEMVRAADEAGVSPEGVKRLLEAEDAVKRADGNVAEGFRPTADVLADPAIPEAQKAAIRAANEQGIATASSHVDPDGRGVAIGQDRQGRVRRVEVAPKPGKTLSQYVRSKGGINAGEQLRGEVERLGVKGSGTTGLLRRDGRGMDIEDMMQSAREAGFEVPETPADFLDLIEMDATKREPVRSQEDLYAEGERLYGAHDEEMQRRYEEEERAAMQEEGSATIPSRASSPLPPRRSPAEAAPEVPPTAPKGKSPKRLKGERGALDLRVLGAPWYVAGRVSQFVKKGTQQFPRLTEENPEASEATSTAASSHVYAKSLRDLAERDVVQKHGVKPNAFGAAMTEDNLRGQADINRTKAASLRAEAAALRQQAKANQGMRKVGLENKAAAAEKQAADLQKIADNLPTLVGPDGAFPTEAAYQAYLALPEVKAAAKAHEEFWNRYVEPMYRQRQGIDPDAEPQGRGRQLGGRMSLLAKSALESEAAALEGNVPPAAAREGSLRNKNVTKSPYSNRLVGAKHGYVTDYTEIMASKVNRETFGAAKRAGMDALVEGGDAVLVAPGERPPENIKGEDAVPFTDVVAPRRATDTAEAVRPRSTLYVREGLAAEVRRGWKMDRPATMGPVTRVMGALNTASLTGLADNFVNITRGLAIPLMRPMSGRLKTESVLNAVAWPVQVARHLARTIQAVRASAKDLETQAEMARIGASRSYKSEPILGDAKQGAFARFNPWSILRRGVEKVGTAIDRGARYQMNHAFDSLVKHGHAQDTPTNRRDFVNQMGNYVRAGQGPFVRTMVDTGLGPFTQAKVARWGNRFRVATADPGAKATGKASRFSLALEMLTKATGAFTTIAAVNALTSGSPWGRPGTPFGNIDTGKDDEQGRPLSFGFLDATGLGDVAKMVGGQAYITAKRRGMSETDALESAMRQVANQGLSFAASPTVTAGTILLSGNNPYGFKVTPEGRPGESEYAARAASAFFETAPLARILGRAFAPDAMEEITRQSPQEGADITNELRQQLSFFGTRPGLSDESVKTLPDRVRGRQLNEYIDDLKRRVGNVPEDQREEWLEKQTEGLPEPEKARVWRELSYRLGGRQRRPQRQEARATRIPR